MAGPRIPTTLLAIAVAFLVGIASGALAATDCNGSESACYLRYDEASFGMTHNAFSKFGDFAFPNQLRSIGDQLERGVRGMMLDTYDDGGDLKLCHGSCSGGSLDLVDTLVGIRTFLESNRSAIVTLVLENYVDPLRLAGAFVDAGLDAYAYAYGGTRWPLLGEMVEMDKRLIVFVSSLSGDHPTGECDGAAVGCDAGGCSLGPGCGLAGFPWLHAQWWLTTETPYSYSSPLDMGPDEAGYCGVDRGIETRSVAGGEASSIFILNNFITPASHVTAFIPNDYGFILEAASGCAVQRGRYPNFIAVDFENCDSTNEPYPLFTSLGCVLPFGHSHKPDVVRVADELNRIRTASDLDGDGLFDWQEAKYGTRPDDPDSDDDDLGDGDEIARGTDPLRADSDGDGVGDGTEVAEGADPLSRDSDADGYEDGTEHQLGCSPVDPSVVPLQPVKTPGAPGEWVWNGLLVYASPQTSRVDVATDPSCSPVGRCGASGFCTAGRVSDACTQDGDCTPLPDTCRVVIGYADVPDLTWISGKLERVDVPAFDPPAKGCSRKVDVTLEPGRRHSRLRLIAKGTVDGRYRRDVDLIRYRR